jgi:hypothetical protein
MRGAVLQTASVGSRTVSASAGSVYQTLNAERGKIATLEFVRLTNAVALGGKRSGVLIALAIGLTFVNIATTVTVKSAMCVSPHVKFQKRRDTTLVMLEVL